MNPVRKLKEKKILLLLCFFLSKMKINRIQYTQRAEFLRCFLNALYSILPHGKQDLMLRYPSEILKMKYIMHGQIGMRCRCQHYMQYSNCML